MSKQCAECGSISNDEAPRCISCGGSSWQTTDAKQAHILRAIAAGVVIILIAVLAWVVIQR